MNPAIRACIPTFDAHRRIPATRRPSDKRAARARLRPPDKPTHHALMVGHELSSRHKARRIRTVVAKVETCERRTASNHDHPPKTKSMKQVPYATLRYWLAGFARQLPSFPPASPGPIHLSFNNLLRVPRACWHVEVFPLTAVHSMVSARLAKDTGVAVSKRTLGESQHSRASSPVLIRPFRIQSSAATLAGSAGCGSEENS
jgi:hypothetical protein